MQAMLFADCAPKVKRAYRKKPKPLTLEQRFEAFHESNGHVYRMLREMAIELKRAGHDHWGMRNLWERLRFDLAVRTTESNPRLNNIYAPCFARKLMAEVEELR